MHTFSRGSVHISSTNPYDSPVIDPRFGSNPLDLQILAEGFLFNNKILNTSSMRLLQPESYSPWFSDANASSLMPAITSGLRSENHGKTDFFSHPFSRSLVQSKRSRRIQAFIVALALPIGAWLFTLFLFFRKHQIIVAGNRPRRRLLSIRGS